MEAIVLSLIPGLANYPLFLNITCLLFAFYFGGLIFQAFWGLLTGFRGFK